MQQEVEVFMTVVVPLCKMGLYDALCHHINFLAATGFDNIPLGLQTCNK